MVKIIPFPRGFLVAGMKAWRPVWRWFAHSRYGGGPTEAGAHAEAFWQRTVGPLYLYDALGREVKAQHRNPKISWKWFSGALRGSGHLLD